MSERLWRIAELVPDGDAEGLEGWPPLIRQLLYNRGLVDPTEIGEFVYPESHGHDPFLLRDMDAAVDRVLHALRNEELIAIYGDFDVDGLTATALLLEVLRSQAFQGNVITYLPHRGREGYGLNPEAIRGLAAQGVRLLITVDCGIGADVETQLAASLGMDVIVTDHHRISEGLPPAVAVLNPKREGCPYPFLDLAGVGVACKLAEALLSRVWDLTEARRRLLPQMDLVALGTVADLAPLVGENRLMVKAGLQQINRGERLGLKCLLDQAGHAGRTIDAESIAYILGPRINAAGRMGDARLSLDLLTCTSADDGARMAAELEAANRERQVATATALSVAREELSRMEELPPALVLAGDYPAGIVGLVASRLAEEYRRPSFVIELGEAESRGSGRGLPGFDVLRALAGASELLMRYGGHMQAGGFALETALLPELRDRLEAAANEQMGSESPPPELFLDATVGPGQVGPALHEQLQMLEPYGVGNPRPIFYAPGLFVRDARIVGNSHLKLWLNDRSGSCAAIGFGMGVERFAFARSGARVDCAFSLSRNERNGTVGYEMMLKDVRPARAAGPLLA
jgi:single-stranded-DNA-specific exonuclease